MLQSANAAHALPPGASGAVKNIPTGGRSGGGDPGARVGWVDGWVVTAGWQPRLSAASKPVRWS